MAATQQASELQTSDEAYQQIFREKVPVSAAELSDLPLDRLVSFCTADIGFRPYPPDKLSALAEQPADGRQRYNARKLVAEFFGVTEYEIQKAVKLTQLIPELSDILENTPKQLNLACADLIADYDGKTYDGPAQENIL